MRGKIKLIFVILLFAVSLVNVAFPIFQNLKKYTEKFDLKKYEKKYNNSQYVISQSKTPISDEELLSYAGYQYATGVNPILINSDHPPLGKYIIGWFTILTGNNRTVSIFFGLANLIIISLIILFATQSLFYTSLGVFFLSLDTVFINLIVHSPILDIIQVFFLLLYFYYFLKWIKNKKVLDLVFSGLSLGCFSSIKLYLPVLLAIIVTLVFMFLTRKGLKKIIYYSLSVPFIAFFIYTFTYLRFFILGNSFKAFLGVQKWIFLFWKNNSLNNPLLHGNFLKLIFFNQWRVWWGNKQYIQYDHWSFLWIVFFVIGLGLSFYFVIKNVVDYLNNRKLNNGILHQAVIFLSLWILFFTCYIYFIPIVPRYLMLLYLPVYILIPLVLKLKYVRHI